MISTPRTYLLPMDVSHFDAFAKGRDALAEFTQLSIPDTFPWSESEEHFAWFREQIQLKPRIVPWTMNMIVHTADQTVIGEMGAGMGPDKEGWVMFGYHIVPAYRGQGFATEVAKGFIEFAFEHPEVVGMRAETLKDGIGSIRVLEKNGFEKVKETEETFVWERKK